MTQQSGSPLHPLLDERQRRSALVLRAIPVLMIPVIVSIGIVVLLQIAYSNTTPGAHHKPLFPVTPIVVIVILCSALVFLVRIGRPTISALLVIGAWTLLTTIIAFQTGISTNFPALLLIPICAAGLLIDGVASVSLAALASVLIISVGFLQIDGLISSPPPPNKVDAPIFSISYWLALFWTVAALTSLLAGSLQRALKHTRAQAGALQELSMQLEARVKDQTSRLLNQEREAATLAERARLAREIHDTLAQELTGIVVQLGAAQRALANNSPDAPQHIELAQLMAREALDEARCSVWNLRAPALEGSDLADALSKLASRPPRPNITVQFTQSGSCWPLTPSVESALLRVAQEALNNVAKHANATSATVCLDYQPEHVQLSIHDDGVGFNSDVERGMQATSPWGGFGLLGMRERLAAFNGIIDISSQSGALVVATVPREQCLPDAAEVGASETIDIPA